MGKTVTGAGATPGQGGTATNVQGGQPNLQPPTLDQPAQPTLESLYQLSETDKAAIMAMPENLRNPAIAALNQARVDFEKGMQEKLEEGRQAKANMDALFADPRFQDWMAGQGPQAQPPAQQQQPPPQNNNYGNLYGEQAEQMEVFMTDLTGRMKEALGIDGIQSTLQNLQRNSAQTEMDRKWAALEDFTKANNLPDPNGIKSQVFMLLGQNPNMTLDQAYNANVDLQALSTRPPITPVANTEDGVNTGDGNVQPDNNTPTGNAMPGSSKSSAVPRTETQEIADPVERAFANRAEGNRVDPTQGMHDAFAASVQAYNDENGTNFTVDDFSNE